jgi:hypothetical protein
LGLFSALAAAAGFPVITHHNAVEAANARIGVLAKASIEIGRFVSSSDG